MNKEYVEKNNSKLKLIKKIFIVSLFLSFLNFSLANASGYNSQTTHLSSESIVTTVSTQEALQKQKVTITGKVVDAEGIPVIGANIIERGTTNGTVTNVDGSFTLSIEKNATIRVTYIGFLEQTIRTAGKNNFNITLSEDAQALDELVVVGYGSVKKKDLTGSVTSIGRKEIEMSPMTSSISGMLQGKSSGVNVMISSASPTSPVSVVIRGMSSLSGSGQPLWVIDGVPQYSSGMSGDVSNTLYKLNLNDVESVDILKDASATAIYGSRAANGVVIVTTKTGAEGMKPTIEVTSRVGWQVLNSNEFRTMNAEEYKTFSKQANMLETYRQGNMTYFTRRYMDESKFKQINTSQWDITDIDNMWLPNAYYDGTDNYWDMMTQNALVKDFNIALRGGSQNNSYFASLTYKDQDGIVKGSNSKNIGARFNFEATISKKLKFGLNMDVSSRQADYKDGLISKIIGMRPDYPAYDEDGNINTIDFYTKNPLIELKDKNYSESRSFNGSSFLEYTIIPSLKFRSTLNTTYANQRSETFNRRYYSDDVNSASHRSAQDYVIVWDNLLTYFKTIGKHDVQAILGSSLEKQANNFMNASGSDFPDDDILTNLNSAATRTAIGSNEYSSALVSSFARLQYKFYDRYLFTGTFRTDGSSRFGADSRWGYFPSGALAWIMSEEDFMENINPIVSYLKLRVSHGLTGSQNLGYYDYTNYMTSILYDDNPGVYPSSIGNSTLQWESQTQTDIGIDYGLFEDRVRGTIGWYRKYVDNLISQRPIPTSSSFSTVKQNIGAISNTGYEFDVTVDVIKNRDLTWEVNFNTAHNKGILERLNGVTNFIGGTAYDTYRLEEGGRLGSFYGYVDAGRFYQNNEEVWALKPIDMATGKPANYYRASSFTEADGDIYVVDLNGDGKITADGDRTYLGNSNPNLFGGIGSTLYWKGLMMNMTFTYGIGGKRYWEGEASKFGGVNVYNAPSLILDSWTMQGIGAKYPVVTHYGAGQNSVFTNRWLHDTSFLRLSALNISYRLPQKWFDKYLIKGIDLTFQATNLFTITKYPGMDPQGNFSASADMALRGLGTDYSTYPAARNYNLGLKFTFN